MIRISIAIGVLVLMCAVVLQAQAPALPKPGPEQQKLQVFLGNWTTEGEVKPSPLGGQGGKTTGADRMESIGGFFVQRNFTMKTSAGERKGVHILGYDPAKK